MKKDSSVVFFRFCLMFGDSLAIIASFLFAYLIRTKIDSRPYYFVSDPLKFTLSIAIMIPAWLIILVILGLYNKKIILARSRWKEVSRLLAASIIGVMFLISFDFFANILYNCFNINIPAKIYPCDLTHLFFIRFY